MDFLLVIINVIIFLLAAPLFEGVIRKVTAKVQSRQGPPVIQPYFDIMKLLGKENVSAGNWAFRFAPVMALSSILAAIAFLPFGHRATALTGYADIITVIYLLTFGGVSVLLGALSSRNIYAAIGASREMVTMIMVEPVLAMTFILGAVRVKSLSLDLTMFHVSEHGYIISVVIMLFLFLAALQAFVGRQPFDLTEAETEIVEGPLIEYSGPNLALFKLYIMLKQMFYAALFVSVFVPFSVGVYGLDVIIQLLEIAIVYLLIALVGATNPRFRIDQAVKYYALLIAGSLVAIGLSVYGI
jgi:formate hydrogenlyase subunit 4